MTDKNMSAYRFTISFDRISGEKLENMKDRSQYVRNAVLFYGQFAEIFMQSLEEIHLSISALQKTVESFEGQIDQKSEKIILPEKEPNIIRDSIMEMLKE